MSFRSIEDKLKRSYSSESGTFLHLLNDFYIPVLKEAVEYKRVTGYFSSSSFALAAEGLANFVERGGKLKFLINVKLEKEDTEKIKKGLLDPQSVIASKLLADTEDFEKEAIRDHAGILGWLIAKGILDLRVGYIKDPLIDHAILHQKTGILVDSEGNTISFGGSNNESASGWMFNSEKFKVFYSWKEGSKDYIPDDVDEFETLWNNQSSFTGTLLFPDALKRKLIQLAPKDQREANELAKKITDSLLQQTANDRLETTKLNSSKKVPKLRYYQNDAITNWLANNNCGIFAMATGTGKTYAALGCAKAVIEREPVGIIIVTPQNTLTEQWISRDLPDFGFSGECVFGCSKSSLDVLANKILDINSKFIDYFFIGTTYSTFCKDKFIDELKKCNVNLLLISDEVHSSAADEARNGLVDLYKYRLGLSATPRRYMDDDGTALIYDYFYKFLYDPKQGDTYVFDLKRALTEVNPDDLEGRPYLAPYEYFIFECPLTPQEFLKYEDWTKQIRRAYYIAKENGDFTKYKWLLNQRKDLMKNAHNKIDVCLKMISKFDPMDHALFFLDTNEQIKQLKIELTEKFPYFICKTFTTEVFSAGVDKRQLLSEFSEGTSNGLLSIGCFNEGIDVPSTRFALFIASSTNPKEFVQRRGRVLRWAPGKTKAIICDVLVTPGISDASSLSQEEIDLCKSVLVPELQRYKIFSEDSLNMSESFKFITPLLNKYRINYEVDLENAQV